ncbi:hypothetical protein [Streptomyces sp. NBC_01500]|uniref:hypothetical protein n=1 Tax=Streptomyces sp. NBC_01500 TaxID=2903886 RepID=UPI002254EB7F|nr:hypothetical protein [Streptomyces sp. NBC_01500]MCX4554100.1 hypothetical protein [Streptomyces sp. NBC_01500]
MSEYLVYSSGNDPDWDTYGHAGAVAVLKSYPHYWAKEDLKVYEEFCTYDLHGHFASGYVEIPRSEWLEEFGVKG